MLPARRNFIQRDRQSHSAVSLFLCSILGGECEALKNCCDCQELRARQRDVASGRVSRYIAVGAILAGPASRRSRGQTGETERNCAVRFIDGVLYVLTGILPVKMCSIGGKPNGYHACKAPDQAAGLAGGTRLSLCPAGRHNRKT